MDGTLRVFATEFAPLALPSRFRYLPPAVAKGTIYDCLHHPELPVTNPLVIQWQAKVFDNVSDIIPPLIAYEYRGYIIGAWARPEVTNGSTSLGMVYKRDKFSSMSQVQRIEGKFFKNKEQAEQHGLELCREWIDNQFRVLEATMKE
jgi:hypothetical protein